MVVSSLKLLGWTLEEIIHNGYHGFIDYVLAPEDWHHLQTLLDESLENCDVEIENIQLRRLLDEK